MTRTEIKARLVDLRRRLQPYLGGYDPSMTATRSDLGAIAGVLSGVCDLLERDVDEGRGRD